MQTVGTVTLLTNYTNNSVDGLKTSRKNETKFNC